MDWQLIDEGFPGMGWRCGAYTIRPSSVWRGMHTLRHDKLGRLGCEYLSVEDAKLAAGVHNDVRNAA